MMHQPAIVREIHTHTAMFTTFYIYHIALRCPTLENPQYGSVVVTNDYRVGSKATYTCIKGYKLVGVAERTCQYSGVYSDEAPICKRKENTGLR
jgi:hypothetical protein